MECAKSTSGDWNLGAGDGASTADPGPLVLTTYDEKPTEFLLFDLA